MGIERFFSEKQYNNLKADISLGSNPLVQTIISSGGEIDFQIRPNNKFNLYYQGNSLAEVTVQKDDYYKIKIHEKFNPIKSAQKDSKGRFPEHLFKKSNKSYYSILVERENLLKFFQKEIMKELALNIKKVNYGEEITFEQSLITDNLENENFIIIDRQISGSEIKGRMDLLGLRKANNGFYRIVVLEVKLGNSKDLKGKVVKQIESYMATIQSNISHFQNCYEKNYVQKKELGLFPDFFPDTIKIDQKVEGKIVVGLYSKIGRRYIEELVQNFPKWKLGENIIQFKNELTI